MFAIWSISVLTVISVLTYLTEMRSLAWAPDFALTIEKLE